MSISFSRRSVLAGGIGIFGTAQITPAWGAEGDEDAAFRRAIGVVANPENRALDPVIGLRAEDWATLGINDGRIDMSGLVEAVRRSGPDRRRWRAALASAAQKQAFPHDHAVLERIQRAIDIAVAREAAILQDLGPGSESSPLPPVLDEMYRPALPPAASLLDAAIAAHGGKERWSQIRAFTCHMSIGGALFSRKGQQGMLASTVVDGSTRLPFARLTGVGRPDRRVVFTPNELAVQWADGRAIQRQISPIAAFEGHKDETPWNEIHLGYFCGYANWNYLVVPFAFAGEGFKTQELPPVNSGGQLWRRLHVSFPASFPTHGSEQTYYFDERYLLRRLDYHAPLAGSGHIAHFCDDHRIFDGIVVPTTRRAYRMDGNGDILPTPVAIDIHIKAAQFT